MISRDGTGPAANVLFVSGHKMQGKFFAGKQLNIYPAWLGHGIQKFYLKILDTKRNAG